MKSGASNYHHIKCQGQIADMGAELLQTLSGGTRMGLNFCQGKKGSRGSALILDVLRTSVCKAPHQLLALLAVAGSRCHNLAR